MKQYLLFGINIGNNIIERYQIIILCIFFALAGNCLFFRVQMRGIFISKMPPLTTAH